MRSAVRHCPKAPSSLHPARYQPRCGQVWVGPPHAQPHAARAGRTRRRGPTRARMARTWTGGLRGAWGRGPWGRSACRPRGASCSLAWGTPAAGRAAAVLSVVRGRGRGGAGEGAANRVPGEEGQVGANRVPGEEGQGGANLLDLHACLRLAIALHRQTDQLCSCRTSTQPQRTVRSGDIQPTGFSEMGGWKGERAHEPASAQRMT